MLSADVDTSDREGAMATTRCPELEHGFDLRIPAGAADLRARLDMVEAPRGLVVVANGDGDRLYEESNRRIAEHLLESDFATFVVDLLTASEAAEDAETSAWRFNQSLLTTRLLRVLRWIGASPSLGDLELGFFASGLCAGAALAAASVSPTVRAVVCRGARFDPIVVPQLHHVKAEVLLLLGERDTANLGANRGASWLLPDARLTIVPGAGHMLDEPTAVESVIEETERWFDHAVGGAYAYRTDCCRREPHRREHASSGMGRTRLRAGSAGRAPSLPESAIRRASRDR
jgi:pimeloyl-ACP methyl ester carboxylesterase